MSARRARSALAVLCPLCRTVSTDPAALHRRAKVGADVPCATCSAALSTRRHLSTVLPSPPHPPGGVGDDAPPLNKLTRLTSTPTGGSGGLWITPAPSPRPSNASSRRSAVSASSAPGTSSGEIVERDDEGVSPTPTATRRPTRTPTPARTPETR